MDDIFGTPLDRADASDHSKPEFNVEFARMDYRISVAVFVEVDSVVESPWGTGGPMDDWRGEVPVETVAQADHRNQ